MSDWGPWIEHDGTGCPCVGQWVQTEENTGESRQGIAGAECIAAGQSPHQPPSAWVHKPVPGYRDNFILRYRVRRPRAMQIIDHILADLPVREKPEATTTDA